MGKHYQNSPPAVRQEIVEWVSALYSPIKPHCATTSLTVCVKWISSSLHGLTVAGWQKGCSETNSLIRVVKWYLQVKPNQNWKFWPPLLSLEPCIFEQLSLLLRGKKEVIYWFFCNLKLWVPLTLHQQPTYYWGSSYCFFDHALGHLKKLRLTTMGSRSRKENRSQHPVHVEVPCADCHSRKVWERASLPTERKGRQGWRAAMRDGLSLVRIRIWVVLFTPLHSTGFWCIQV